ncbi:MAG TPA: hypothetical protein VGQ94_08250, partial [Terriglobales bacterium]|nr:hypothetical protein [Terriglobales bacterium]
MKKVTVLVFVLMFAVAAWAYQGSYGSSTKASTPAKTSTASTTKSTTHTKAAAAGPKESTMTGCLSGPNADGEYLVKNGNHRSGMEVVGMNDLKTHVGHKVKLTGTWVKESPEVEAKEAKGEKGGKEADEK